MDKNTAIIDLLRHGETTAGHRFIGSTDVALTEKGWQQMHNAVSSDHDYDAVVTSPLIRCLDFSKKIVEKNNSLLGIRKELREFNFGDWENKSSEDLWKTDKKSLEGFWQDPVNNTPPNAESLRDFNVRVNACIESVLMESRNKKLLIVAHAGVIKIILANILSIPLNKINNLNIAHASLSQIRLDVIEGKNYLSVNYINCNEKNI
jgi:alpha-ribazole phosphatase